MCLAEALLRIPDRATRDAYATALHAVYVDAEAIWAEAEAAGLTGKGSGKEAMSDGGEGA